MPLDGKVMGTVLWDAEGCILVNFIPRKEIVNVVRYIYIIHKL
jgi:hypothetical protein